MIETITPATIPTGLKGCVHEHLRIDDPEEMNAMYFALDTYIAAAVQRVEAMSGRLLFTQELRVTFRTFSKALPLPVSPVQEIVGITYKDAGNATQTFDPGAYVLKDRFEAPTIVPAYQTQFPDVALTWDAVTVTLTAGYGSDVSDVPGALIMAVLQTVTDWYRFAGNVATSDLAQLPDSAYRACLSFRRNWA